MMNNRRITLSSPRANVKVPVNTFILVVLSSGLKAGDVKNKQEIHLFTNGKSKTNIYLIFTDWTVRYVKNHFPRELK
jgi:hypothetical protein